MDEVTQGEDHAAFVCPVFEKFMQNRAGITTGGIHFSGGVALRRDFHRRLLLNIGEIQNIARQNHVHGKVVLIRGVWVYDDWQILDLEIMN